MKKSYLAAEEGAASVEDGAVAVVVGATSVADGATVSVVAGAVDSVVVVESSLLLQAVNVAAITNT